MTRAVGPSPRGGAHPVTRFSSSRRARRSGLPTAEWRRPSRISTADGTLYLARFCRQKARISSSSSVDAVARHHEGLDQLPARGVGDADHQRLEDLGMLVEHGLHLGRVDVHPGADDHVLEPVDDAEVAVAVQLADVAGVQPAVAQLGRRLLRAPPVPLHHLRAADDDLAGAGPFPLEGHVQLAGLEVDHPRLGAGIRQADGAVAVVAERRVAVGHRPGLGQAVALHRAHAGALDERALHGRRQRRAGAGADAHRAQVAALDAGKAGDRDEEGRHHREDRRPQALDGLDQAGRVGGDAAPAGWSPRCAAPGAGSR